MKVKLTCTAISLALALSACDNSVQQSTNKIAVTSTVKAQPNNEDNQM